MLRNTRTPHRNGKGRVSISGGFDHSLANTVDKDTEENSASAAADGSASMADGQQQHIFCRDNTLSEPLKNKEGPNRLVLPYVHPNLLAFYVRPRTESRQHQLRRFGPVHH